jgi:acyl carrier protein
MNSNAARLTTCFTTVFPELPEAEIPQATISTVARWDSVATVTLLSLVGEEFGIEVDFDHFEELTSFQGLLHYVEEHSAA